jgi:hypothetical protein
VERVELDRAVGGGAKRSGVALEEGGICQCVPRPLVRAVNCDGWFGRASNPRDRVGEWVEAEEHLEAVQNRQMGPGGRVEGLMLHERLILVAQAAVLFASEVFDELGEPHEQP